MGSVQFCGILGFEVVWISVVYIERDEMGFCIGINMAGKEEVWWRGVGFLQPEQSSVRRPDTEIRVFHLNVPITRTRVPVGALGSQPDAYRGPPRTSILPLLRPHSLFTFPSPVR